MACAALLAAAVALAAAAVWLDAAAAAEVAASAAFVVAVAADVDAPLISVDVGPSSSDVPLLSKTIDFPALLLAVSSYGKNSGPDVPVPLVVRLTVAGSCILRDSSVSTCWSLMVKRSSASLMDAAVKSPPVL